MPDFGLVLDLSHTGFAAVLSASDARVLASEVRSGGTRHDDLGDWLEGLLRQAGAAKGWHEVAWICVGLGPGSFTGIRIAMAFAQGVALPLKIPLFGFTSFEALFLSFPADGAAAGFVAAIAANAGRFYVASGLDDPGVLTSRGVLDALVHSDGSVGADKTILTPGEASWDYPAIARHARADGGRHDARKPYYLQLSAAEDKAVADRAALDRAG
jgi:tRNA threonylcarbamoyl adenosine modification protein YeaZ